MKNLKAVVEDAACFCCDGDIKSKNNTFWTILTFFLDLDFILRVISYSHLKVLSVLEINPVLETLEVFL